LTNRGSGGVGQRTGREPDPGPHSGVLPINSPDEPPRTPTALPIGPRAVLPASRKSLSRRDKKGKKVTTVPEPDLVSPLADVGPWGPKEPPEVAMVEHTGRLIRPYTRTGGRTRAQVRLELETLLSTANGRDRDIVTLRDDYRLICEMCRTPQSTAEISARLSLPLGAARVLISDVVQAELLFLHELSEEGPTVDLLSRVAAGLRRL
jgi:hypothetical protein